MAQGIIEKTRKKRRGNKFVERPDTDKRQNPKILDLQLLRETVENVCSHHLTDAPKSEWESNRRWSYVSEFHLAGVLGHVDMPTWVFMIEQNIEWTREMRETVQPNGNVLSAETMLLVEQLAARQMQILVWLRLLKRSSIWLWGLSL